MKKFSLIMLLIQLVFISKFYAQNIAINELGSLPDTSAMLDVSSTTKGFLVPRMTTTQQNAIPLPAKGLLIFNTTDNNFKVNVGIPATPNWQALDYVATTTNALTSTGNPGSGIVTLNTLTSTVNGVAASALIINTISNTSATNTLTTNINGVAATGVPIINTVANTSAVNSLTTRVNGIAATAVPIINTVANTSAQNSLTTTVNGVASTGVPIINTVANTSAVNSLTTTVNGVAATPVPMINTVANTSAVNTITTRVNGIAATGVPMINSNTLSLSGTNLVSTVNGVASNSTDISVLNFYIETSNTDNTNSSGNYSMDNLNMSTKTFMRFTGARYQQQFKITGITGGVSGKTIVLYNTESGNMIFSDLNSGSAAANQILTLNGSEVNTNGSGAVTLVYDGTASKWIITSIQQ
ncbi:MAG: hypothetical protein ABIN67_11815 [Ferruginibacter sp.]